MCQSLPSEAFHDIWNPAAGLFPFLLLIFLGWSLACGDHRLLPLTALDASYVVQTHLMYAAPTAVLLGVGFGGLALALARAAPARAPARAAREADAAPRRGSGRGRSPPSCVALACWTRADRRPDRAQPRQPLDDRQHRRAPRLRARPDASAGTRSCARSASARGGCTCRRPSGAASTTSARCRAPNGTYSPERAARSPPRSRSSPRSRLVGAARRVHAALGSRGGGA